MKESVSLNTVYNEDCLETLSRMADNSINVVITSPPYNMNLRIRKGAYCSRQIVKEFSTKYEGFDDNLPIDEFYNLHSNVIKELLRVSNLIFYNISIVTGSKRAFFKIIGEFSDYLKDIIVWDKGNGQPAMSPGVLNRQSELILIFDSDNAISRKFEYCNFERGTLSDIWTIKRGKKIDSSHGATFPEELVEKILLNFTKEGDTIYDPFMGTGTTAGICTKLGRNYIGSESSKSYCDIISDRVKN